MNQPLLFSTMTQFPLILSGIKSASNLRFSAPLRLNVLHFLCFFVAKTSLHFQRQAPLQPLQRHYPDDAADIREPNAALSGFPRDSTLPFVSFQRIVPHFPFAICAGKMQFVQ
jgi:hypothetical protein